MAELGSFPTCSVQAPPYVGATDLTERPRWYAAYTLPRHEKSAAQQLDIRAVHHFLPVYRVRRRWQHRQAEFELPLFPGYLFVHITSGERLNVLTTPGVLRLVGTAGRATPLEDREIEALRGVVTSHKVSPAPYLQRGKKVRFAAGALAGLTGTIVRNKGLFRVIVSVDTIMRSISIEVDGMELESL